MEYETTFVDTNKTLDIIFEKEYWNQPVGWTSFIKSKDLGIQVCLYFTKGKIYLITDEKKWMLTRIKYGI